MGAGQRAEPTTAPNWSSLTAQGRGVSWQALRGVALIEHFRSIWGLAIGHNRGGRPT